MTFRWSGYKTIRFAGNAVLCMGIASYVFAQPTPNILWQETPGILSPLREAPLPEVPAIDKELAPDFQNPDFQDMVGGFPAHWTRFGLGDARTEGSNHYIHTNVNNSFYQDIAAPVTHRHMTVSARARGELGFELPAIRTVHFGGEVAIFNQLRVGLDNEFDWRRVFVTEGYLLENDSVRVVLWSNDALNWVDWDDVLIFDEGLKNGGFESDPVLDDPTDWTFDSGAYPVWDKTLEPSGDRAVFLPPGGGVSQISTAKEDGQSYFIAGRARASAIGAELQIVENWQDERGDSVGEFSVSQVTLNEAPTRFTVETGNCTQCAISKVEFNNDGSADLLIDDLSRGFTSVYPSVYFPYEGAINPNLALTVTWPNKLADAEVEILSPDGSVLQSVPLTIDREAAWGEWDGFGSPPGAYDVKFVLESHEGEILELVRPFTIGADPNLRDSSPLVSTTFQRGAWIWMLGDGTTEDELRSPFVQAIADGFTCAVVFARSDQWPAVVNVCEELNFPFIAADSRVQRVIKLRPNMSPIAIDRYRTLVDDSLRDVLASPQCLGHYIADEPSQPYFIDNAADAARITASTPGWKSAFATIHPTFSSAENWEKLKLSVNWTDFYALEIEDLDLTAALNRLANEVEQQVRFATAQGREFWLVAQSISEVALSRSGNAPFVRATTGICAALGARGYVPFPYRAINSLEGVRGRNLEELPETNAWVEGNARLAAASGTLLDLRLFARTRSVNGPLLVSTARDSADNLIVFVVSLECRNPTSVELTMTVPGIEMTEISDGSTMQLDSTKANFTLEPGEWKAWRVSSGSLSRADSTVINTEPTPLALPVVAQKNFPGVRFRDLDFSPDGSQIAAVAETQALVMGSNGVELGRATSLQNVQDVRYVSNERALVGSSTLGVYGLNTAGSYSTFPSYFFHTGSSRDLLVSGNEVWIGNNYFGARRTALNPDGTLTSLDHGFIAWEVMDLAGPFADGSVLALDQDAGLRRVTSNGAGELLEQLEWVGDRLIQSALTKDKRTLVTARMRQGFSLHRLDENGHILDTALHRTTSQDFVERVAWTDSDLLVVGEYDGDVEFFRVDPDLSVTSQGIWRREPRGGLLTSIATYGEHVAISFLDGRLVILDVGGVPVKSGIEDWVDF